MCTIGVSHRASSQANDHLRIYWILPQFFEGIVVVSQVGKRQLLSETCSLCIPMFYVSVQKPHRVFGVVMMSGRSG